MECPPLQLVSEERRRRRELNQTDQIQEEAQTKTCLKKPTTITEVQSVLKNESTDSTCPLFESKSLTPSMKSLMNPTVEAQLRSMIRT